MTWGKSLSRDVNILSCFSDNPVLFDVGANVGQTLQRFKANWPSATVHCFEPTPDTFMELERTAEQFKDVKCHRVALSSACGPARLISADDCLRNQIKAVSQGDPAETGPVDLHTSTIDSFCKSSSISRINLLKVDTEGHDLQVLRGGSAMLTSGAVDLILTEVGFGDDARFCTDIEVRAFLSGSGFRLAGVYDQAASIYNHGWPHAGLYFANMLFIRDGLIPTPSTTTNTSSS